MRALVAVLAGTAVLVTVSACTSAKTTSGEGSPLGAVSATSSSTDTPTDTVTSSTQPSTSATSPSTPPTVSFTFTGAPPTKSFNTCDFTQLGIRALRGSGAQQREYAAILFTNKGTAACDIYGYPGVSLRDQNTMLGLPAARDTSTPPKIIKLTPGAVVQADIIDDSSCQAPLSDTVRVYPPDSIRFVDLPLQLRGCTLTVKPVAAS